MNEPADVHFQNHVALVAAKLRRLTAEANGSHSDVFLGIEDTAQMRLSASEGPSGSHSGLGLLELSDTETEVVWFMAAVHVSAECRSLTAGLGFPEVQLETLRLVVYGSRTSAAFKELSSDGILRSLGILERIDAGPPGLHESRCAWGLSRRVLAVLHSCDDGADFSRLRVDSALPESAALIVDPRTDEQLRRAFNASTAIVCVVGLPGTGRRSAMAAVARASGIDLLQIDARRLSKDLASCREELRAVALESRLRGLTPLVANFDALADGERTSSIATCLAPFIRGRILLTSVGRQTSSVHLPMIVVEMGQPTTAQRATLWHSSLGQGTADDAQLLAERYPLAPALIVRASEAAKTRANGRTLEPDDIYAGIRSVLDDRLGQFAKRVTVTQTWDDLVLPPDQLDTIVELMARVRGRTKVYEQWGFAAKVGKGLGVSALFSGPPGTGKTMVAALIARDLGLELYQVDMGKVVSKFIGETEKNLGALFDAAEAGHAILLFDEADALFGKRTDVKSSNDRYANLETNYLLQRLESFTGICLLTTNHDSHIDPAFQRRLSLHLRFELPDVDERAQLWRATLPIAAPLAGNVDFASLARRYAMSGGYIRNAALRAAFLAADEDSEITAAHLERAARVEYEGMGKIAA